MNKQVRGTLAMAAVLAMLSACGGGGEGDAAAPAVTAKVPDSASQSVPGLMRYMDALVVVAPDGLEPVDVSSVALPTDDTIEPQTID